MKTRWMEQVAPRLADNQGSRRNGTAEASRPTLDAHVESLCAAIRTRGHLGLALPIDPPSKRRVDQLLAGESARFQMAVVR